MQLALTINNDAVKSAFPSLYSNIAKCHEDLNDPDKAKKNYEIAASFHDKPSGKGLFYHGTKADLQVGDLLTAGGGSNYKPELKMNHIYFTALANGAGLGAALAKGDGRGVLLYRCADRGFENDPNVTDKVSRQSDTLISSEAPLRIVAEVTDWVRQTPEELQNGVKRPITQDKLLTTAAIPIRWVEHETSRPDTAIELTASRRYNLLRHLEFILPPCARSRQLIFVSRPVLMSSFESMRISLLTPAVAHLESR